MTIDDIDLKILDLLLSDGRMSHTAIGKETDLSGPSVYARVQRLEREWENMLDKELQIHFC